MTGDQKEVYESEDEQEDDDDSVTHHSNNGKGGPPKLLTDIERVIEGLHNTEEIDNSVEQLEALLYGGSDGGGGDGGQTMDDGFHWASSRQTTSNRSAFSFDRTEQKDAMDDDEWGNLPSYQTTNTYGDGGGDSSDESEWTQDLNSEQRESVHNSQVLHNNNNYERQGSLELALPAGGDTNNPPPSRHRRPQYKTKNSSSSAASAAASYKYQISFYIQMQLCNPSTLADWIKHRNGNCVAFDAEERQVRARPAFEIFRQIVNGLAHVHAKGIIHRDLKPANIFAGDDGAFMVGDFGLSKMIRDANNTNHRGVDNNIDPPQTTNAIILPTSVGYHNNDIHTSGVGTASYASPEQTTSKTYGTAADIFSLGLILLELFSNFTSEHERGKAFHDCRHNRELAPWMKRYYPEVSTLILACTQADWSRRPSASDIQAAGVFQEKGNGVEIFRAELRALKVEITRKDTLIQSQKEQMEEKDGMIEKLRRRLAEVENNGMSVNNAETDDNAGDKEKHVDIEDSSSSSSDDDY